VDILPAEAGQRSKARDWLAVLVLFAPPPLPARVRLCYKPDMRKWMRDRLKRRQKTPEAGTGEPAPAPLQPAYFDAEVPPAPAQAREAQTESAAEPPASGGGEDAPEAVTMSPVQPPRDGGNGNARRRRRRRGRGGRGRGGAQTVGSAAQVEAAKPSPGESSGATARAEVPAGVKAAAPAPRAPKGSVILAIGLPGSGKSSWFKRHNITPLSSDLLRALLFDDPTEQRFQDLVFSNLRSMLKARLIARRPLNYVDATNLTPHERHSWIKLAHDYGYEVQAVFFDVPLEVCLERNQRRQRVVGDDIMRRMSAKLRPPTFEEGFSKITVVRVKRKE
jgi:predicted kinase